MKKICSLFIAVFVCFCFFGLTGCSVDYSKVAGNYYLVSRTTSSQTLTVSQLVSLGVIINADNEIIHLDENQNYSISGIIGDESGAYSIDDSIIIFSCEDKTSLANFENDKIVITTQNAVFVYEKRG